MPVQHVVGETYLIADLTLVRAASVQGADGGDGCAVDVGAPDLAGCLRRGRLVHGFGQRHVACSLADELVLGQAEPPAPQRQRKVKLPLVHRLCSFPYCRRHAHTWVRVLRGASWGPRM